MAAACYLYGVVDATAALPAGLHGLGPTGEVRSVAHRGIAAVVGEAPEGRLGGRDDLLAHHGVVDAVAAEIDVLPMRFGAVLPGPAAVVDDFLLPQHDRLSAALEALRGRRQFTVDARYDRETILREIVQSEPDVARLREITRGRDPDSCRPALLQLGELVVANLERRRAVDAARLADDLAPHTVAVAPAQPGEADTVLRAAFLVDTAHRVAFENAVEHAGSSANGRLVIRLVGPQPPYDFIGGE